MKSTGNTFLSAVVILAVPALLMAAAISDFDSTQPRGAPVGLVNDQNQSLDPVTDGFRAPARFDGEITPLEDSKNPYRDWLGMTMANAARDPAFFATLNVANEDFINFIKFLPDADLNDFLVNQGLADDVFRDANGVFQCVPTSQHCLDAGGPENILPVAADLCLRCHSPVGWMEGHSEPPTTVFPFLKGQFWGAAFLEEPVDVNGDPKPFDITIESEAEMEGVQCDFCHRAKDNYKRDSLWSGSMVAGNGGFLVELDNPFDGLDGIPKPEQNEVFQKSGDFCGTCHDVTNPFLKTRTEVNGAVPDMLHPLERTYTEWFWSEYRNKKPCQECHKPMRFVGAQTWLLFPGIDWLWGDLDQKWLDRGLLDPATYTAKSVALEDTATEHLRFMKSCAQVQIINATKKFTPGSNVRFTVRVTNKAGHKLPTGYGEGRQMWLYVKAVDASGATVWEDGILDASGQLVRTSQTKVYEQKIIADGYQDTVIDPKDKEFHFVLLNKIEKDNRIPPKGYNKAAYQSDGAFIVPENTYADGQYWDDTTYSLTIPSGLSKGNVKIYASLYYQTFNKEYVEFLDSHDNELTVANGGRARDLPAGGLYASFATWGGALHQLWQDVDNGRPVFMGQGKVEIQNN